MPRWHGEHPADGAAPPVDDVGSFPKWWSQHPELAEGEARIAYEAARDGWVRSWHRWVKARPRSLDEINAAWLSMVDLTDEEDPRGAHR